MWHLLRRNREDLDAATLKARTLYQLRRYEEAVEFARDATRHSIADLIWPYVHLPAALGQLGRTDEAPGSNCICRAIVAA